MPFDEYIATLYTGTSRSYREDLLDFGKWFTETNGTDLAPALVTSIDLKDYRVAMLAVRTLKPATVNRRLAAIRSWLRWCEDRKQIESLPLFPKRAAEVQQAPKALDKIEQDRLLRVVERSGSQRDKALVGLMLYVGLRVGETVKVAARDIELSERKGKVRVLGKGMKEREIPLGLEARDMIRLWYSVMKTKESAAWLFPGQAGKHLSARAAQQMIKKYAYQAKIDLGKITPHVLRHTFATRLLREGKDLVLVAALLGHARLDTTAKYTKPSYAQMESAVE